MRHPRAQEIFPRGKRQPRPETWCHPESPYRARGMCDSCYQKFQRERRPGLNIEKYRRHGLKRACRLASITVEDYERVLARQAGVCAICMGPPKGKNRLSIDHDHKTGQFRGLLCDSCNRAIGYLKDDSGLCLSAADYLRIYG